MENQKNDNLNLLEAVVQNTEMGKNTLEQIVPMTEDLRAALGSVADRAIIPMADWLGLGEEAHLNSPGKLGGNWSWRAADGFDTAALAKRILAECAVYCRT